MSHFAELFGYNLVGVAITMYQQHVAHSSASPQEQRAFCNVAPACAIHGRLRRRRSCPPWAAHRRCFRWCTALAGASRRCRTRMRMPQVESGAAQVGTAAPLALRAVHLAWRPRSLPCTAVQALGASFVEPVGDRCGWTGRAVQVGRPRAAVTLAVHAGFGFGAADAGDRATTRAGSMGGMRTTAAPSNADAVEEGWQAPWQVRTAQTTSAYLSRGLRIRAQTRRLKCGGCGVNRCERHTYTQATATLLEVAHVPQLGTLRRPVYLATSPARGHAVVFAGGYRRGRATRHVPKASASA
eukprot:362129-Chlamydomonas_euryale.AAC.5